MTSDPPAPRDHGDAREAGGPSARPSGRGVVPCPFCGSWETEVFSLFGSSPLTSQHYCRACRTVFERVKWRASPQP